MAELKGNGKPTRFTKANDGDVYIDLDSGKKYECLGLLNFVDIDSVEEPVEYNWKEIKVSSIDDKFITDLYYTEPGSVILPETKVKLEASNDCTLIEIQERIPVSYETDRCKVVWNGVEYDVEVGQGSMGKVLIGENANKIPFQISGYVDNSSYIVKSYENLDEVTFAIYHSDKVKPMPEKYLPDGFTVSSILFLTGSSGMDAAGNRWKERYRLTVEKGEIKLTQDNLYY